MASPTDISPSATIREMWYCPVAAISCTCCRILLMSRWPVTAYRWQMPRSKRPEPSRLMIMYRAAASKVRPVWRIMIRPQAEIVLISTNT